MTDEIEQLKEDTAKVTAETSESSRKVSAWEALTTVADEPVAGGSIWRHPVFIIMGGGLLATSIACITAVAAVFIVNDSAKDARNETDCNRKFAAIVDEKLGLAVAALADGEGLAIDGLAIVGGAEGSLAETLKDADIVTGALDTSADALVAATLARTAAIKTC